MERRKKALSAINKVNINKAVRTLCQLHLEIRTSTCLIEFTCLHFYINVYGMIVLIDCFKD